MARDTVPPEEPYQDEPSQTLESAKVAKQERAAALVIVLHTIVLHTIKAAELLERALQTRDPDDLAEADRYMQDHEIGEQVESRKPAACTGEVPIDDDGGTVN